MSSLVVFFSFDIINNIFNFRIVFSDSVKNLKDRIVCKIISKKIYCKKLIFEKSEKFDVLGQLIEHIFAVFLMDVFIVAKCSIIPLV